MRKTQTFKFFEWDEFLFSICYLSDMIRCCISFCTNHADCMVIRVHRVITISIASTAFKTFKSVLTNKGNLFCKFLCLWWNNNEINKRTWKSSHFLKCVGLNKSCQYNHCFVLWLDLSSCLGFHGSKDKTMSDCCTKTCLIIWKNKYFSRSSISGIREKSCLKED